MSASKVLESISSATNHYPEPYGLFAFRLKPIDEIKAECLVVLDTNALLLLYEVESSRLTEIATTFTNLSSAQRLIVPAQVAREFAKNRPTKLKDLFHALNEKKNVNIPSLGYPMLEALPEYEAVIKCHAEATEAIKQYRKALGKLTDHVKGWLWNDPVSELYAKLFTRETIVECLVAEEELKADHQRRLKHEIAPGYHDKGKPDNGVGDNIIWHTILQLGREKKRSVIFVTQETKSDWFYRSSNISLYPKFELVEEFSRISGGAAFHILKLSEMLEIFGAEQALVKNIQQNEALVEAAEQRNPLTDQAMSMAVQEELHQHYLGSEFSYSTAGMADFNISIPTQYGSVEHKVYIRPVSLHDLSQIEGVLAWITRVWSSNPPGTMVILGCFSERECIILHRTIMEENITMPIIIGYFHDNRFSMLHANPSPAYWRQILY